MLLISSPYQNSYYYILPYVFLIKPYYEILNKMVHSPISDLSRPYCPQFWVFLFKFNSVILFNLIQFSCSSLHHILLRKAHKREY